MQVPEELEELRVSLERIRTLLENLVVRGLRACGPDELSQLGAFSEHLEQTGAGHLASLLSELRNQIERDERTSARKLLETQISVRLLERLLTLRVVKGHYATAIEAREHFESSAETDRNVDEDDGADEDEVDKDQAVHDSERKQLTSLLDELGKAVEELLLAGLTAASKSTVERLDVSFKEASRMKLLRLGSTLRIANEEIARFTGGSSQFSARRLAFFLGRAWLLASAMRRAIDSNDQVALNQLQVTPPSQPVEKLKVVTLGVAKRVVPGTFASFDFRLRALGAAGPVADHESLIWSCVFPLRKDLDLPAEAFLHLPQKQKFKPSLLLEKKVVEVTRCAVSVQTGGTTRLALTEASTMTACEAFAEWPSLLNWDLGQAAERLQRHRPTPMDLEIELQEEVFISDWRPGEQRETEDGYDLLPIETSFLPFEMRLDRGPSGVPVRGVMTKIAQKKRRPPIYGVAHYESCRIILQPLSALGKDGIEYLTVSPDKISQAALVKAMKFT